MMTGSAAGIQHLARDAGLDPDPPALLAELERRALTVHEGSLLVRGALPPTMVAVVGARASDPYGLALARRIAMELAARGIAVVSGGAEGCDHAAHLGALDAGGKTVVVLPGGHDHPYPRCHLPLFERVVAQGGAIVSACWPTIPIARYRFLARNRVIAELARGVIVARAHARSGSLSTARAAGALGRPVAAVPGAVGEALSAGCHLLLEEGAVPMVGPRSLDRWLGRKTSTRSWPVLARGQPAPWSEGGEGTEGPPPASRDAAAAHILNMVRREPGLDLDAMAVRTGTPIAALAAIVLGLEIEGVLERWPGGRYHLRAGRGE
jgi:DNA processing protein